MTKMFEPEKFFAKLDYSSQELRKYADEFADFLATIKEQPASMLSLIKSLRALKTMPIDTLDKGVHHIQLDYCNLHKEITSKGTSPFDSHNLEEFIQKNEKFNQQAKHVLTKAVELYQSIHGARMR